MMLNQVVSGEWAAGRGGLPGLEEDARNEIDVGGWADTSWQGACCANQRLRPTAHYPQHGEAEENLLAVQCTVSDPKNSPRVIVSERH